MSNYILSAKHIQKKYSGNTVLKDVSIHIEKGSIYGLIGKNGSGKTTLLRVLTGLIQNYSGDVYIQKNYKQKCKLSAIIDSPSVFLNMNAFENMKQQSLLLGINDDNLIKELLKIVGLNDYKNKEVKNFSLGMTQRLKLAMSLLGDPDILILDEPLNGLDPDGIADLRKLLQEINQSKKVTTLISSHVLSELEQVSTHFGILHNGEIVKEISRSEIWESKHSLEALYMQYTKGGNE